jgi:hypothetical protein
MTTTRNLQEKIHLFKSSSGRVRLLQLPCGYVICPYRNRRDNYYGNQFGIPVVLFPLMGWGIRLASHAIRIALDGTLRNWDWEERKLREIDHGKRKNTTNKRL